MKYQITRTLMVAFITGTLFVPQIGFAQSGSVLTLDECIATGLEKNLDVIQSRLRVEQSKSTKLQAVGQFTPDLSVSSSWTHYDKNQAGFINNMQVEQRNSYSISASSNLVLFDGMSNFKTVDKSIIDFNASELDYSCQKETFIYVVTDGYYNTLRLGQLVTVNEANLKRSREQLEKIKQQNSVGSVPKADVYRQEVEVGNYDLQYRQSLNDFDNAKADLLDLIGEHPDREISLDESSVPTDISISTISSYRNGLNDYSSLYSTALQNRLDYKSSELSVESAGKSVSIAFAGHLPTLSAGVRYNWNNYELKDVLNDGSTSFGLSLSIPILSNLRTVAAVQQAKIAEEQQEEIHNQLQRTIAVNVRKALNTLDYAAENVRIAQQTLRSAEEDQKIAQERYTLGAGTLLDLTTANANLISAESDVVNSKFTYLRARVYLEYQLGISQ